jgi:hypothetical protein
MAQSLSPVEYFSQNGGEPVVAPNDISAAEALASDGCGELVRSFVSAWLGGVVLHIHRSASRARRPPRSLLPVAESQVVEALPPVKTYCEEPSPRTDHNDIFEGDLRVTIGEPLDLTAVFRHAMRLD